MIFSLFLNNLLGLFLKIWLNGLLYMNQRMSGLKLSLLHMAEKSTRLCVDVFFLSCAKVQESSLWFYGGRFAD